MKRFSRKRRKRISEVAPFREAFKLEVGRCELCGKRRGLVIHEIARGTADRQKALDKRYAILVLCDPGCHQKMDRWPRSKQLALLLIRRPYDWDLPSFHALTARCYPDHGDVLAWVEPLMEELK